MKKNILTKFLFMLLIVLLAFSVVACNNDPDPEPEPEPEPTPEEENFATAADINKIIDGVGELVGDVDAVENQLYMDVALIVEFGGDAYRIEIEADIDGEDSSQNVVVVKVHEPSATTSLLVEAYLVDDVLYINQMVTANPGKAKFSNLDALELSQNLSSLPGMLNDMDFTTINEMLDSVSTMIAPGAMQEALDSLIADNEVLTFEETDDEYRLIINSEGLGTFISALVDSPLLSGDDSGDEEESTVMDEIMSFALNLLFGVDSFEDLEDADPDDFPELSIVAKRDGDSVVGLSIDYEGDFGESVGRKEISFGIDAIVDNSLSGSIEVPTDLNTYVESVIKASVTLDLGLKDLFLKADLFANPDLSGDIEPTAYLVAIDGEDNEIANLDAYYDGHTLSFDLAGLYGMFDVAIPAEGSMYFIDLEFADLFGEEETTPPVNAAGDPEPEESLPFELTDDLMGVIVGKINTIYNILIDTVFGDELALSLDLDTILDLADGILVNAEDGTDFDMETDMVPYLEETLAEFASDEFLAENPEATDAQKAQSVILEITGADLSVQDILTADGEGNAQLTLSVLEDALGLNFELLTGNDGKVLDFTLEFDLVALDSYNTDMPAKDYTGAIDLNSESEVLGDPDGKNIYTKEDPENPGNPLIEDEEEVKGYFILDELERILEAYRQYTSEVA